MTILPARWREALDHGEVTIAAAAAVTTIADLAPNISTPSPSS
jgi:hypothetical protein